MGCRQSKFDAFDEPNTVDDNSQFEDNSETIDKTFLSLCSSPFEESNTLLYGTECGKIGQLNLFSKNTTPLPSSENDEVLSLIHIESKDPKVIIGTRSGSLFSLTKTTNSSESSSNFDLTPIDKPKTHKFGVSSLIAIPTSHGGGFCSGSRDGIIKYWSNEGKLLLFSKQINRNLITDFAVHQKDPVLFQSSEDKTIRLWDLNSFDVLRTLQDPDNHIVSSICTVPSHPHLLASSQRGPSSCSSHLWDLRSSSLSPIRTFVSHQLSIISMSSIHPNFLVTLGRDRQLNLWSLHSSSPLSSFLVSGVPTNMVVLDNAIFVTTVDKGIHHFLIEGGMLSFEQTFNEFP
mmetsp:Transcript_9146/g.13524  ORF Transcript_9146/g.13524 Transcript_9146/m.13524 type:complete len:346 (+) Transcript_9146:74-1111(+)